MCFRCDVISARQAQRRRAVLTLQRDDALDRGLVPGPLLLAELECQRGRQLDAEGKLARFGFSLTPLGEVVRPTAL